MSVSVESFLLHSTCGDASLDFDPCDHMVIAISMSVEGFAYVAWYL